MSDDQGNLGDQGLDGDKSASLGWRAGLSDDHKENEWAKQHGKVSDFFKDALQVKDDAVKAEADHTAKMKTAIFKPGENATPEDILAFRISMGVPEKPEDYSLTNGDVKHSPEFETWFRGTAHELGFSKEQVEGLVPRFDAYMEGIIEGVAEDQKKAVTEAKTKLVAEWGASYDENLEFTRRGFEHYFGSDEEFKGFLEEGGLGNHPLLLKAFHKVGRSIGDDWSLPGTGNITPVKPEEGHEMEYTDMEQFKNRGG